jgi:glycosyltransferase involved in cell wall biosynthesis
MGRHVLMVAYHYPPSRGSSGLLRTLNFTRHLPNYGWDPVVLTAHPRAHPVVATEQEIDSPPAIPVKRAFALDAWRHMSIKGRYPGFAALPDRWISWFFGGVPAGLRLIRKYKPKLIWSTYPIATALWIGYALHRITNLPWVVDFRDPLTEVDPRTGQQYPPDKRLWKARRAIERRAVEHSVRTVLVTPGAKRIYAERYSHCRDNHWAIIPNGYEEETFADVERQVPPPTPNGRPIRLLHSGVLYPTPDRNPESFLMALSKLRSTGKICPTSVNVTFRASGYEEHYRKLIKLHGVEDMVELKPAIAYRDALKEMLSADGLLVFQGYTSNPAVPAKLYEYLRASRPILALADASGDTAATLREAGAGTIVPLDSTEQIANGLIDFVSQIRNNTAAVANRDFVRRFARESQATKLAALFDDVLARQN